MEHKQGSISQQEYEKAKAALDQTLERALKRTPVSSAGVPPLSGGRPAGCRAAGVPPAQPIMKATTKPECFEESSRWGTGSSQHESLRPVSI